MRIVKEAPLRWAWRICSEPLHFSLKIILRCDFVFFFLISIYPVSSTYTSVIYTENSVPKTLECYF